MIIFCSHSSSVALALASLVDLRVARQQPGATLPQSLVSLWMIDWASMDCPLHTLYHLSDILNAWAPPQMQPHPRSRPSSSRGSLAATPRRPPPRRAESSPSETELPGASNFASHQPFIICHADATFAAAVSTVCAMFRVSAMAIFSRPFTRAPVVWQSRMDRANHNARGRSRGDGGVPVWCPRHGKLRTAVHPASPSLA